MEVSMVQDAVARTKPIDTTDSRTGYECKTILFNCNCHSFNDVADQLVKAIHCTYAVGLAYAVKVHTKGRAVVYVGHFERCEAVAAVLAVIGLNVIIER